ncbi:MAG: hypothetical protein U7M05_05950 [Candidatus Igneacidithiobacillus chanchocoensis]
MVAGVAASPDGVLLPVLLTYSLATPILIMLLVWLATWLGLCWRWTWLDRNGERLSPLILVILGLILVVDF